MTFNKITRHVFCVLITASHNIVASEQSLSVQLLGAIREHNTGTVQELLDKKASVAGDSSQSMSPLHAAASALSPEIVTLLLNHNAPVDALDKSQYTPLYLAIIRPADVQQTQVAKEIILSLLDHNASADIPDVEGYLPIQRALILLEQAITHKGLDDINVENQLEIIKILKPSSNLTPKINAQITTFINIIDNWVSPTKLLENINTFLNQERLTKQRAPAETISSVNVG